MKKIVYLFILLNVSVFSGDIVIETFPTGAEVFIKKGKSDKKSLGKSPYKGKFESIFGGEEKTEAYLLLEKPGFESQAITIVNFGSGDVELSFKLKPQSHLVQNREIDSLVNNILSAQRMIRNRNHTGANNLLIKLKEKFPGVSVISEMEGSSHYLNRNFEKALDKYREAFMKNTKNEDAEKMKLFLEKKLGR